MYKDPHDERLKAARRKHYHANKQQYLDRNKIQKAQKIEYIRELKKSPCVDCGKSYPYYVMDYDHVDPLGKVNNIARMVNHSWKALKAEIAKCELVCANCHRERTHNRGYSSSWE